VAGGWLDPAVGDDSDAAEGDAAGEGVSVGKGIVVGVAAIVAGVVGRTAVAAGVVAGCSLSVADRQALVNRIRLQIIHTISGRRGRMFNGI
jgi:hypothetical protein